MLPLVPKDLVSRVSGRLARVRLPRPLQGRLNRLFARAIGADVGEAERPPEAYRSLSEFFVRGLTPGLRTWPADRNELGSPSDGIVGLFGPIDRGTVLQAKGIEYRIADLLGSDAAAERFTGGVYLTIYLAPRHYHRVHAPSAAALYRSQRIPGQLFPVNRPAVSSLQDLFVRNERLVAMLEGERTHVAVVAVGALNVGSISADFDPDSQGARGGSPTPPARRSGAAVTKVYDPPLRLEPGDPLMTFHLGSTVVLLAKGIASHPARLHPGLRAGQEIRVGEPILVGTDSRG